MENTEFKNENEEADDADEPSEWGWSSTYGPWAQSGCFPPPPRPQSDQILQALVESHKNNIQNLHEMHKQNIELLQKSHEKEVLSIVKAHALELDSLKHQAQVQAICQEFERRYAEQTADKPKVTKKK